MGNAPDRSLTAMLPIKLTRQDFHRLRRELLALAAIAIFAVAFHFGSDYLNSSLSQKLTTARSAMLEANNQLALVQQELNDVHHYLPRYQDLIARHIVGEEQRLAWIETLEGVQTSLHLPALKYEFNTQRTLPTSADMALTQHKLLTSPMKLEVLSLHEEQLLATLTAIQQRAQGLPLLRSCEMSPMGVGNARITTVCHYDWITLVQGSPAATEQVAQ